MFEIAFSQNANLKIGVGMCLDGDIDDVMAIFWVQKLHFLSYGVNLSTQRRRWGARWGAHWGAL